jgi:hypothetical protein
VALVLARVNIGRRRTEASACSSSENDGHKVGGGIAR